MMLQFFLINLITLSLLNFYLNKKKKLLHKTFGLKHKQKTSKKIILSGGLYLLISFLIISIFNNFIYINFIFYGSIFLLLGIFSDINQKISPQQRLVIMFILSIFVIVNGQLFIDRIDISIIDKALKFNIFSIIFFSACLVILINGSNFIDGTNGNAIGYYILCLSSITYQLSLIESTNLEIEIFKLIIISMFVFFVFNIFNKNFLGDNGAYFISSIVGLFAIKFYISVNISSFFIVNLFLYPVFEVLMSFIRKIFNNKSPYLADKMHLHHLIQKNLKNFKISEKYCNNLTSIVILFLLSIFFYLINLNVESKLVQLKLASGFCITYIIIYLLLKVSDKTNKSK